MNFLSIAGDLKHTTAYSICTNQNYYFWFRDSIITDLQRFRHILR